MDPMILILIFGGGAVVVLLVVGVVITARSERSLVEERLGRYLEEEQVKGKKAEQSYSRWRTGSTAGSRNPPGVGELPESWPVRI